MQFQYCDLIFPVCVCVFVPQAYATDVCVPLSQLPQIIVETKEDLIENRLTGEYAAENNTTRNSILNLHEEDSVLIMLKMLNMIHCEYKVSRCIVGNLWMYPKYYSQSIYSRENEKDWEDTS